MSENLFGKTICYFFPKNYCAATERFKNFSFLFVETVIRKMIHREVFNTINKSSIERLVQVGRDAQSRFRLLNPIQHFHTGTRQKGRYLSGLYDVSCSHRQRTRDLYVASRSRAMTSSKKRDLVITALLPASLSCGGVGQRV